MTDRGPLDLDAPTICDMNCFFPRGHEGRHQQWLGCPCDVEGCILKAQVSTQTGDFTTRRYLCREHA